jgi:hypothetical protein
MVAVVMTACCAVQYLVRLGLRRSAIRELETHDKVDIRFYAFLSHFLFNLALTFTTMGALINFTPQYSGLSMRYEVVHPNLRLVPSDYDIYETG